MRNDKINENIHKVIIVAFTVTCIFILLSQWMSIQAKANTVTRYATNLCGFTNHCEHTNTDNNNNIMSNEVQPCCLNPCNSSLCNNIIALFRTSIFINSTVSSKTDVILDETFYTEDISYSIFKPPRSNN